MGAHESMEHAEHAEHASGSNKKIALLIAVIALFLAFSETLGKGAQTEAISRNVEASNLWAFFQAKSIRRTQIQTAAEQGKLTLAGATDDAVKAALAKQIDTWEKTAARYRSEPETGEGTEQLAKRGTVDVLRHGMTEKGVAVKLAFFEPEIKLDPAAMELYGKNRLRVVRQVRFDPKGGDSVDTLGIKGDEQFDIAVPADIRPQQELKLVIRRKDGSVREVPVLCRIDTPIEVDYYKHGGILPFVLRQLLAA